MRDDLFDGKEENRQPPPGKAHHAAPTPDPRQRVRQSIRYVIPILATVAWFISWPLRAVITRMFDPVLLATDAASSLYLTTLSVGLLVLVFVYVYEVYR